MTQKGGTFRKSFLLIWVLSMIAVLISFFAGEDKDSK
ncbi:Uncharacterised protein [Porphyromonas cangingivalis]|nr:Uncharacterised protein [Porphyromonas cangingivalis]